jgi:hypothetical protein
LALVHVFDSITPSLRAAGFEDDDEDENEAPCEGTFSSLLVRESVIASTYYSEKKAIFHK